MFDGARRPRKTYAGLFIIKSTPEMKTLLLVPVALNTLNLSSLSSPFYIALFQNSREGEVRACIMSEMRIQHLTSPGGGGFIFSACKFFSMTTRYFAIKENKSLYFLPFFIAI